MRKRLLNSEAQPASPKTRRMPRGETRAPTIPTMASLPPMSPLDRALARALQTDLISARSLLDDAVSRCSRPHLSRLTRIAEMVRDALGPIGEAIRDIETELQMPEESG
jgi:hypothetical protein